MTTITLDDVIAQQQRLAAMIEAFKASAAGTKILIVPEATIELRHGERYAGLVLDAEGTVSHHLVLLPGTEKGVNWQAAMDWAKDRGAELPTRQEQALLYANLKNEFKPEWYWSSQAHETDGSCAWGQHFGYGTQYDFRKSYEGLARAVRRFPA